MEPTFENLLAKLADARVAFIVVGGVAVALNGYVRFTEDVDIIVERSPENLQRMLDCLSSFGEGFARELNLQDFSDEEGAIRIVEETELCQIDIFTRMSGLRYEDLLSGAVPSEAAGSRFFYASRASLIRLKSTSVREKDRMDVSVLQRLEQDPHALD